MLAASCNGGPLRPFFSPIRPAIAQLVNQRDLDRAVEGAGSPNSASEPRSAPPVPRAGISASAREGRRTGVVGSTSVSVAAAGALGIVTLGSYPRYQCRVTVRR